MDTRPDYLAKPLHLVIRDLLLNSFFFFFFKEILAETVFTVKAPAVNIIITARCLEPDFWNRFRLAAHLGRADRSQCGAIEADSAS